MLATYRLWFARSDQFPRIPSDTIATSLSPTTMTAISVGIAVMGIVLAAGNRARTAEMGNRWVRGGWTIIAGGLTALFLADQAHLQPWAFLTWTYAFIFACAGPESRTLPRWIAISVYFWSGFGKLDFQFAHTLGQEFLSNLSLGATDAFSEAARTRLALMMPAGEIAIAVGLAIGATRPVARWFAIGLHLALIGILGPWSLDHSWGVLVWNAVLIGQAYLLFGDRDRMASSNPTRSPLAIAALLATVVILVGPVTERRGWWDHWLAWSLYAPHTSRIEVEWTGVSASRLPDNIRRHVVDDENQDGWGRLDLAAWSLADRGVPVYPQGRYQFEVVQQMIRDHDIVGGVRVKQQGAADRWTGERGERWLLGKREIEENDWLVDD